MNLYSDAVRRTLQYGKRPIAGDAPRSYNLVMKGQIILGEGLEMDFNKLTRKSRETLAEAQSLAAGYSHQQVDVEHVLLAMLQDEGGLIPRLLSRMGARLQNGLEFPCRSTKY